VFSTVTVVEVVTLTCCVAVTVIFPEVCGIYRALAFGLAVVAVLFPTPESKVEFVASVVVAFVTLVSVAFWEVYEDSKASVELPF
jgi:hypothetical protein